MMKPTPFQKEPHMTLNENMALSNPTNMTLNENMGLSNPNNMTTTKPSSFEQEQNPFEQKPSRFQQKPNPYQQKPTTFQQLVRGDRSMLSMSDDNVMMRQIQATHAPDGREFDVRPLLFLVEDILSRASMHIDSPEMETPSKRAEYLEDKAQAAAVSPTLDALSYTIDKIACEIAYKALAGSDAHATTHSLCNSLSSYSWDAKLVLTLAAFALNYGEFWLLAHIYTTNQLAKSMAILKQVPVIMEHSGPLKPRFDALNDLIQAMLEVTRVIIQFKELPARYIAHDFPDMEIAMAHIPTAVYWSIRSVVACATQITSITTMGLEHILSTTEAWELSTLAHKLKNIHEHLRLQLNKCLRHIEEKRNIEAFDSLKRDVETLHIDNMKVLKALLNPRDEMQPLYDGHTRSRVNLEILRRKNVLLLISGLNISHEELSILEQIYSESRVHANRLESPYEVVWIPVVDPTLPWNENMQTQFESLQSTMPWYTVHHPKVVEKHVIRFIKQVWHFRNKAILVVLDPQGRVASPNAIHMMWIWGSTAFPFTSTREESLWREEIWRLELLVDGIDPAILNWIRDDKYIFLYGGDDIEWARRFTQQARTVALAARVPLEMVYVGKSTAREKVRRAIATITVEKLSHCWSDLTMIWFFWIRLESMLFSKMQLGKVDDTDPVMREIKKLLSYDKEGGWAILAKGSSLIVNGYSTNVLTALLEYDEWKESIKEKGFDNAFRDHHDRLYKSTHPCSRFELSTAGHGRIPEMMKCPECLRYMEKYITFLCCHDEPASSFLNPTFSD